MKRLVQSKQKVEVEFEETGSDQTVEEKEAVKEASGKPIRSATLSQGEPSEGGCYSSTMAVIPEAVLPAGTADKPVEGKKKKT
ncbi:unnamed protein product [Echinostoma caproni]|uniref:RPN2_C domain-containing protein n=1 Tax=Echinostoma caproni TaxID=27848 RepID=A0A183BGZ5_9TREM|nr:unnamed protein product [Echinostoma caproni]